MSGVQPTPRSGVSLPDPSDPTESDPGVQEQELFDILANPRRRYLVHALNSRSGPVDIGTLAEQLAAWELGVDQSALSSHQRKRLYTSIQQQHLPRMADAGFVEFNADRGVVEPAPAMEDAELYLEVIHGNEIPWSELYLGLAGVFAGLTAVVWLGIWPFGSVPPLLWLILVVATVAVAATCHRYRDAISNRGTDGPPPELGPTDGGNRADRRQGWWG